MTHPMWGRHSIRGHLAIMRKEGWLGRSLALDAFLTAAALFPLLAMDAGGLRKSGWGGILLVATALYAGLLLFLVMGWLRVRIHREMPADPKHPYRGIWRRGP